MSPQLRLTSVLSLSVLLVLLPAAVVAQHGLTPDPLAYVSPSRAYDTVHTRLDLDLDLRDQTISGSVTHEMKSLRSDLTEVALNCVGLEVESVSVDGQNADFDYPVPGGQSTSWFQSVDVSEAADMLVIHPAAPLAMGEEFTVQVRYHGAPKKGLYWIAPEKGIPEKRYEVWSQGEGEDNRYWIPCYDYPNDKATYEGTFRVEKGFYVLSNGVLASKQDVGDKTEFTWRLDQPQVSYLIMVAAARYDVVEDDADGIAVMYVVPPGTDRETVDRGFDKTPAMIKFFSEVTGIDYPFDKYAQVAVQNFIWGGMENTTATVMNMRMLHDARSQLTRDNDGLVAHELAHMWWGDMVTCREWSHMWLNEGFATYYQSLFREHYRGDDAFRWQIRDRHRTVVSRDDKDPRPVVTDFYNRKDARNSANVYVKGSSVLHMMRFMLGDEQFHAVIKHYGEEHKYDVAETSDLMRAVKDVTGENLDWFFEQWIFLAGHPKFKVTKSWDNTTGLLHLNVKQTQEVSDLVPVFRVELDVEATCAEKTEVYRILIDKDDQDFYFALPSEPKMVIFDKGDWILKTLDFSKSTKDLVYQIENGDFIARVRAAEALGSKGSDARTVPALRGALLADAHWGLRREAALALGRVGTEQARDALLEGAAVGEAKVRMACAEALGEFKRDEAAAGELTHLLQNDPAYGVREKAVDSLVKMRAANAADACRAALRQESDRSIVRNAGLNGLVELRETDALDLVKKYALSGNDRNHRHTAITAYAKLAEKLDDHRDREKAAYVLEDMLDDWYLRTRETAIKGLGILGEKSAVASLRAVESNDPLESIRLLAGRTANMLEAAAEKDANVEAVEADVKELQNRLKALEKELDDLRRKVPEKAMEEGIGD